MNKHYDLVQQHDLLTLWIEFLSRVYPDVPKLGKVEGWAAALEYLTAKDAPPSDFISRGFCSGMALRLRPSANAPSALTRYAV